MKSKFSTALLFFLGAFVLYGLTLLGDFVFDDRGILEHFPLLQNPIHLKGIFTMPYWTLEAGLYRPFTLFSYSLNFSILGFSPFGFHLVNILLYGAICFLIYQFIFSLFKDKKYALLSAAIFLVLPIHSEVVANITGRSELLALFFSLLFFLELLKEKINPWKIGIFAFLAFASKETAVAILPISLFVLYLKEKISLSERYVFWKKYFYPAIALFAAAAAYFILRFVVLGYGYFLHTETSIVENPLMTFDFFHRFFTALSVLSMYLGKIFVPIKLCSDYSFNQITELSSIFHPSAILGILIFVFFLLAPIIFLNRKREISLGATIFIFSYIPISNLFFPIGTIAGERLIFFPSLGIAIILGALLMKLEKKLSEIGNAYRNMGLLIFGVIILIYSLVSIQRGTKWFSEEALFSDAAICAPRSVLSMSNLGSVYYYRGDFKKAEEIFLASEKIYPGYSKGLNNLGLVYWKMGDLKKAKEYYRKALTVQFPYAGAIENMALLYLSQNDIENSRRWLRVFYPNNPEMVGVYIKNAFSQ